MSFISSAYHQKCCLKQKLHILISNQILIAVKPLVINSDAQLLYYTQRKIKQQDNKLCSEVDGGFNTAVTILSPKDEHFRSSESVSLQKNWVITHLKCCFKKFYVRDETRCVTGSENIVFIL